MLRRVSLKYCSTYILNDGWNCKYCDRLDTYLVNNYELNIIMIHADSSDLSYCANGEGKDGIKVKICSVDKEKCEKNAKENDISTSCNKMH